MHLLDPYLNTFFPQLVEKHTSHSHADIWLVEARGQNAGQTSLSLHDGPAVEQPHTGWHVCL